MLTNFLADDDEQGRDDRTVSTDDAVNAEAAQVTPPETAPETAGDTVAESAEPAAVPVPYVPESVGETMRKTGLAWSAAIALFGSVVFMLVLGWFADLLLGSSPWGIVAGIVLGSAIGFLQFFRITSQILKPTQTPDIHPLMIDEDHQDRK